MLERLSNPDYPDDVELGLEPERDPCGERLLEVRPPSHADCTSTPCRQLAALLARAIKEEER